MWWLPHFAAQKLFVDLSVVDLLLDRSTGDEPVHDNVSFLSDPPCAFTCLEVVAWVPIRFIQDDAICPDEINTETTDLKHGA